MSTQRKAVRGLMPTNPCSLPPYKARRRHRERAGFVAQRDARTHRPAAACSADEGAVGVVAHVADCHPEQRLGEVLVLGGCW